MTDAALFDELTSHAEQVDRAIDWPTASWGALARHGVLRQSIPRRFGGKELTQVELLTGNEMLAASCPTTAFILSQHEVTIRQLTKRDDRLQERYLSRLASSADLVTIGVSQLTTSRQHGGPAMTAQPKGDGSFRVDGVIPWVTGADHALAILAGATLVDGTQILFMLAPGMPGVTIDPPMILAALAGSRTAQIRCDNVVIPTNEIIAGPMTQVLGPVGGGGLETSCLGLGIGRGALGLIISEAKRRPDVEPIATTFENELSALRRRLHEIAGAGVADPETTLSLRADATLFALRVTQMALLLAKGTGYVAPHPAQRFARQAQFLLVWSCPRLVSESVKAALMK